MRLQRRGRRWYRQLRACQWRAGDAELLSNFALSGVEARSATPEPWGSGSNLL
jgi:hypothetical protein